MMVPERLEVLVVARDPLRLVLSGRTSGSDYVLLAAGFVCLCLVAVGALGMLGLIETAGGGWTGLATVLALAWALCFAFFGLRARHTQVELTFESDRLVAVHRMAGWGRVRELPRSSATSAQIVDSEGDALEETRDMYPPCLRVEAVPPAKPLWIGRGLRVSPSILKALRQLIDEWLQAPPREPPSRPLG